METWLPVIAVVGQAVGVCLVIAGWRSARNAASRAEADARAAGETSYSQLGGARLDLFNATIPFARLVVTPSKILLPVLGRELTFEKREIVSLRRHRGLFSTGLRIEHSRPDAPSFVVFWTANFAQLAEALSHFGYFVAR